jgi:hypothetical protein
MRTKIVDIEPGQHRKSFIREETARFLAIQAVSRNITILDEARNSKIIVVAKKHRYLRESQRHTDKRGKLQKLKRLRRKRNRMRFFSKCRVIILEIFRMILII